MGHLAGKVALVTGAGGGIGRAVARLFAAEGAAVVAVDLGGDRDGLSGDPAVAGGVAQQIVAEGGRAIAVTESVATTAGAAAIVAAAVGTFGQLDVLVNAAGVAGDARLEEVTDLDWEAVLGAQAAGTLRTMRAALPALRAVRGRIVNTGSLAGMIGAGGHGCHAAADAAIHALTRTAAIELQRHGVTANLVVPLARTRLTEALPELDALTPEHVAPAYLFLGSDLCGDRTGQVVAIAGGRVSTYRVQESAGRFTEAAGGLWTAAEIAEQWSSIAKG